jgi:acyl carrier protein
MTGPHDPLTSRVAACFRAVFPDLPSSRVTGLAMADLAEWDSVNQAILMATIEDEFGIAIPAEQYALLTTFTRVRDHVTRAAQGRS